MNKIEEINKEIEGLKAKKEEWRQTKIKSQSPFSLYYKINDFLENIGSNYPFAIKHFLNTPADARFADALLLEHNKLKNKRDYESYERHIQDAVKGIEWLILLLEKDLDLINDRGIMENK